MASTGTKAARLRGIVAVLAVALAGCTEVPDTQHASLPLPTATQAESSSATQREHLRILASYGGVYDNAKLQALIDKIIDRLVAASERPDLKYKVIILNSPAINAFALPNGQLYVTRGLIALANDEAELASVLAHEMGHVIANHAAIRQEQAEQDALIKGVVGGVLSDQRQGALALAQSRLTMASFSRAQEFEADGIGVGISARAGFDPFGAARMLTDMQRNSDLKTGGAASEAHNNDYMSSHPATPDRIKKALINARQFSSPGSGLRGHDEFLAAIDGLVYGEDPGEGYVRGRRFLHAKLGFTFEAPPAFILDNTAQAVLGLKDGGGEAMRLDVVSVPAEQTLPDYLKSGWIENVDPRSVEEFTINGFPAATATAAGKEWSFRLYAVRFGSDVYRFIYAAKIMTAQADREFKESVMSFRRMSLAESEQVKPQHLKVVTVAAGDSVAKLAHRMAVPNKKVELFRVLNGFSPTDQVKPGQKVKLVTE